MQLCTLIIPTYNAPHYLKRILTFYSRYGPEFKIIVGDSSLDKNKKENKKIISSFTELEIEYRDEYKTETNPHNKFADLVKQVKTKYVVFCAEDDFVLPNGIKRAIEFLEKNKDFVIAQGDYINFCIIDGRFQWEPGYKYNSIIFNNAKYRSFLHLSNYSIPTVYGVFRTESLKRIYQEMTNSKIDTRFFGELFPSILTLVYGKLKYLNILYGARNTEMTEQGKNWLNLLGFIKNGECTQEERNKFIKPIAKELSKESKITIEEAEDIIKKALNNYLKKIQKSENSLAGRMKKVLDNSNIPNWLDKRIRIAYRQLNKRKDQNLSSNSQEEFNKIKTCVLEN